jgi:hypothetical protein
MGGTNDPSNLVELTVKQHAQAHKKLYEKHGLWQDRIAWQMLSGQITSNEARLMAAREANLGNKHFLGKTHSEKHKKKLSKIINETRKKHKHFGHYMPHTEESKEKMKISLLGNTNKRGKFAPQKNKFKGQRTWLIGDKNIAKRTDVREKIRQKSLLKKPCSKCKRLMNAGNLSRHEPLCVLPK